MHKEMLWKECEKFIRNIVTRVKISYYDSEDFVQEAAVLFFKNFDKYYQNNDKLYISFIIRCLKNRIISVARKQIAKNNRFEFRLLREINNITVDDWELLDNYYSQKKYRRNRQIDISADDIRKCLNKNELCAIQLLRKNIHKSDIKKSLNLSYNKMEKIIESAKKKFRTLIFEN